MLKKKWWKTLAISAAAILAISGCAAPQIGSGTGEAAKTELVESAAADTTTTSQETAEGATETDVRVTAAENLSTATVGTLDLSDLFTDRDKDGSYDAAEATTIRLNGTDIAVSGSGAAADGTTVTITEKGTYVVTGTLADGQIIVDADDEKVQLVLAGVSITNDDSACILIKSADKVFLTLADGTENELSDTGKEYVQTDDSMTVDAVIFSKDDITINGAGTLTVKAGYKHGIVTKDDLKITDGTITVTAANKGLAGKDSVRIAGGDITITAADDAIHTSNSEDDGKGYVAIVGGTLTISAGDDGVHAEQALVVAGGTIDIKESYEGLEGKTIDITGGDISIYASDDGINAAYNEESDVTETGGHGLDFGRGFGGGMDSQADTYLRISGGNVYVNANGDGLDANGYLYVDGGTVLVDGPTSDGDGALDTGISATITGGTVIAAGSSGMAETFGSDSTQYSVRVYFDTTISGGTTVILADADGNEVLSATPTKNFSSVVFSSPALTKGNYTVYAGDETVAVEISDISTTVGTGGRGGFGDRGGFGGGRDGFGFGQSSDDTTGDGMPQRPEGGAQGFGDGQTPPEMPDGQAPTDGGQNGDRPQRGFGGGGRGQRGNGNQSAQGQQTGGADT